MCLDRKIRGISLVELLLSMVGLAILVGGSFTLMSKFSGFVSRADDRWSVRARNAEALIHVQKVGRLAQSCVSPSLTELECTINYSGDGGLSTTDVRFRHDATKKSVLYEKKNGASWVKQLEYFDIGKFIVCDTAAMAANNCPLSSTGVDILALAHSVVAGRFFRIALEGDSDTGGVSSRVRTAFFVRHPTGLPSSMEYVWGSQK